MSDGTNNATYAYLANSPLVGQITFKSNTITRMTTTKTYDYLNRLTQISSAPSASSAVSFGYSYNDANQRVRVGLADGSFWLYEYDSLGQVLSGKKYWADWTPVAGQQFEYAHDDIGNRSSTKAGGDDHGANLRVATYSVNNLNQYTNRTVPGAADVIGVANAGATVTVNNQATYRKVEYYRKELSVNNTSAPQWQSVTNKAVQGSTTNTVTGNVFLPKTPEVFIYDADGNLLSDGRWTNSWDAENRLISLQGLSSLPTAARQKLDFDYDWQGRRIRKTVSNWNGTTFVPASTNLFLYDGWNLVLEANPSNVPQRRYMWGLDLSGSEQGAGGVGGLLAIQDVAGATGAHFAGCDGNGNVVALVKASDGTASATYEYGPFGEVIRATGPMAKGNPFRFSTKYQDDETDLLYYGYRYYNASTGHWLSRDPLQEHEDQLNEYAFLNNNPVTRYDVFGLWGADVHHQIVDDWLKEPRYVNFHWYCCRIDVRAALKQGSDDVDGNFDNGLPSPGIVSAQSSAKAYQHAMRSYKQTVSQAEQLYNGFLNENIQRAKIQSNDARRNPGSAMGSHYSCLEIREAVVSLGRAFHAFSDSLSPAHGGFQIWLGPVDFLLADPANHGYPNYLLAHHDKEVMAVYNGTPGVAAAVEARFQNELDYILRQP